MRLRIGLYIGALVGGGAERVVVNVLRGLDRERFEPYLLLHHLGGAYDDLVPEDVTVVRLAPVARPPLGAFRAARQLAREVRAHRIDVVNAHLTQYCVVLGLARLLFGMSARAVLTEQNNLRVRIDRKTGLRRWAYRRYLRLAYRGADAVTAVSERLLRDVIEELDLPRTTDRSVVYNCIDFEQVSRAAQGTPAVLPPPSPADGSYKIVTAGRLHRQKGYTYLLRALALLAESGCRAHLYVLGDGGLREELVREARGLGIADRVDFVGFVDNPWAEIAAADVYVMASLWEGFANAMVEAMACGTPVVCTACDYGPDEIIEEGVSGRLVPVADPAALARATYEVLNAPREHREAMAARGRRAASSFVLDRMVAGYAQVYTVGAGT